jgi:PPM family protein phosphatase
MRRLVAAGATDVGKVRKSNEDAFLLRDSVFAVADGMGGHLAGEVASATALKPIEALEGRVFREPNEAIEALRLAVVDANHTVCDLAEHEPAYRGMGTTLTAALVEGRRLHIAHVGDSRAYLLRDGRLSQLTDDHTLVQHLVDEGQITREEAARHPQRSIITRAIGVAPQVEVDSLSLELQRGDQLLLCSDGLTGAVEDEDIAAVLRDVEDPDAVVELLVSLANASGGHDNITVLLLRFDDHLDGEAAGHATADGIAEAPQHRTISITTREERPETADWAGQLGSYGNLTRGGAGSSSAGDEEPRAVGKVLGRASAIALAIVVIVGLVAGGGRFLLSRSFYVGLDAEQVVIYQGIDADLGPLSLSRVVERTELTLADVPEWYRPFLESGRTAADLNDARRIVANAPRRDAEEPDDPEADDSGVDTVNDATS